MLAFLKPGSQSRPWTFRSKCGCKNDGSKPVPCKSYLVVFIGYLTMYLIRKKL